jgi:hypothetical protein
LVLHGRRRGIVDAGERRNVRAVARLLQRLAKLPLQHTLDGVRPRLRCQRTGKRQHVRCLVTCNDDQVERRNLGIRVERSGDAILHLLGLRMLSVAAGEDVLVEKALLRQRRKKFEAIGIHRVDFAGDDMLQQRAAERSQQALQFEIVHDLGLEPCQQRGFVREAVGARCAEQFDKRQLSRPGGGHALQCRGDRGALLHQHFRIAQAERQGIGEVPDCFVAAAKRLIGDGDGVVSGGVGRVQFERLGEQLHCELVAAALLH